MQLLVNTSAWGNFLLLFSVGVSLSISRYLQGICHCVNTLSPSPQWLGEQISPAGPSFLELTVCLMENCRCFFQHFQPPHLSHRLETPPLKYGYGRSRSLFLSKITFISLVSLTSVSVWSHTSTLTGNSHQLQNLGSTSPSPRAAIDGAAGSAMPPTSKHIPPAHGLTQEAGNRMPCSLSSTSPQPPLYSSLGPRISLACHGPGTSGTALLAGPLQAVASPYSDSSRICSF